MASPGSSRPGGSRFVLAAIVDVVALVFIGQGLGIIPGSIMTGDLFWAAVGVAMLAATTIYLAWPRLRGR